MVSSGYFLTLEQCVINLISLFFGADGLRDPKTTRAPQ